MSRNYSELWSKHDAEMLYDADDAITQCNLWEWLKEYTPEEGKGFAFCAHPNLIKINEVMEQYPQHSGCSYAWTMRQMEYIAKNGWENYYTTRKEKLRREAIVERLRNLWLEGKMPYEDFAKIRDTA